MISGLLPRNAEFVHHLEISGKHPTYYYATPASSQSSPGYIYIRLSARSSFEAKLSNAIRTFRNLDTVNLSPTECQPSFIGVLSALTHCHKLRELIVNRSCMDEPTASVLRTIEGLERLTLQHPTRAVLNLLPEWLGRLSTSLNELHLKVLGNYAYNPCYYDSPSFIG